MASAKVGAVSLVTLSVLLFGTGPVGGASRGGLHGVVMKGPITPVCRAGVPCDGPAQVTLRFTRTTAAGATSLYTVRSKAGGSYRLALPAGYYSVTTKERVGITRNIQPRRVHVRRAHWDRLDFFIDTGIR
jgi:hypothetical protein